MLRIECDNLCKKYNIKILASLSEQEYYKEFSDKIDWSVIFKEKLSEEFLERFQENLNWNDVSFFQTLSIDFIKKFKKKLNWKYIEIRQSHIDKNLLFSMKNSKEYEKIQLESDLEKEEILAKKEPPPIIKREYIPIKRIFENFLSSEEAFNKYGFETNVFYEAVDLCKKYNLNIIIPATPNYWFIKDFVSKIDWGNISFHQNLSEAFIEKFQDYVNWDNISYKQKLSCSFIRKFNRKVNWFYISYYQKELIDDFINEFQDKIFWMSH